MENIKIQSTVEPTERISHEQWNKEFRIGIMCRDRNPVHNANTMMKLWDQQIINKYYKKLKLG
jgi:hypothetical protein